MKIFSDDGSKIRFSFEVAYFDRCADSEPWIEGLSKCGVEPVQEAHGAANAVKGQHPRRVV